MNLKETRKINGLTQKEVSEITNIPLRTYKNYENDPTKENTIKYKYILERLEQYVAIDETHGILTVNAIREKIEAALKEYPVEYVYLFGSYARGTATPTSDVDLLISTKITGIQFFGIAEKIRTCLSKKVDLLDLRQLENNIELTNNILREGIKIYKQTG